MVFGVETSLPGERCLPLSGLRFSDRRRSLSSSPKPAVLVRKREGQEQRMIEISWTDRLAPTILKVKKFRKRFFRRPPVDSVSMAMQVEKGDATIKPEPVSDQFPVSAWK